jgi:hypothetical protein
MRGLDVSFHRALNWMFVGVPSRGQSRQSTCIQEVDNHLCQEKSAHMHVWTTAWTEG